jgi:hypothetical protein
MRTPGPSMPRPIDTGGGGVARPARNHFASSAA